MTEELRLGRPVIVRIQFPDTGHFVVVDGYRASGHLRIRDPNDGTVFEMRATALHDRYVGNGRWTHTYYTEA